MRAIGEQPAAAFVRGTNVVFLRYFYTLLGGALVGIGGAAFSLDFKAGWSHRHTAGYGWIALAIVIFGILQSLASVAQSTIPNVPTQVFTVAPFVLMILFLLLTSSEGLERLLKFLPPRVGWALSQTIRSNPPAALGRIFQQD